MRFIIPSSLFLYLSSAITANAATTTDNRTTGTTLIKDGIVTRTDISQLAGITSSIRNMFHFCENNNGSSTTLDAAHEFYKGKHSSKYSLQELATLDRFKSGLTFAFQIYGLIGKD
eukprot:350403_1